MSPCNWPVVYPSCASCPPLDSASAEEKLHYEELAVDYLWRWTFKQFGVCEIVLRPCDTSCTGWSTFWGGPVLPPFPWPSSPSWPSLINGQWYSLPRGGYTGCTCGTDNALVLPGPAVAINEIVVDGVSLVPADYRLDKNNLYRTDGQAWPLCQDLSLPSTEVGTWEVRYDRGIPVPMGGQMAAGLLACELAKAMCRDSSCALPQRVQTITRQGVTMAMLDPFDGLKEGHTGIWAIDSWVSSIVNPTRPARVYSVDMRPRDRGREALP